MLKFAHGLAWPDADTFMVNETQADGTYQSGHLAAALRHVTNFATAIDGGSHVGLWTRRMSQVFQRVLAVEPSPDTFEALTWNLQRSGCTNVEPHPVALGAVAGSVSMVLDAANTARANTGARHVTPGGDIPVVAIDAWHLPDLGFLKLDVEGSELAALQGAQETLRRCQPIVLYENKALWTRYFGAHREAVQTFLTLQHYRLLETVGTDVIWGPR